jgi:hypothetical protein
MREQTIASLESKEKKSLILQGINEVTSFCH